MPTPTQQQEFIAKITPLAQAEMRKHGILASLTIAQAICESGWGLSGLTVKANALFGIKAGKSWQGKVYSTKTKECYDGKNYAAITDAFRAYDSWEESVADHSKFLLQNNRYSAVIGETDYKKACKAIHAAGYATSPTYAQTLIGIIEDYELVQYDGQEVNNMPKKTTAEAVKTAITLPGMPYWYACSGERPTQTLLDYKVRQYPKKWTATRIAKAKGEIGKFAHCFDCVGFIRYICGMQNDRNALYTNADKLRSLSSPQPISTLPEQPGVLVFMSGHVGLYIGEGRVIECYGFKNVANRPLSAQNWTHWGRCPWLLYKLTINNEQCTIGRTTGDIAKEVLAGKWGNGDERRNRLTQAGYDPAAVQKRVNEMLGK